MASPAFRGRRQLHHFQAYSPQPICSRRRKPSVLSQRFATHSRPLGSPEVVNELRRQDTCAHQNIGQRPAVREGIGREHAEPSLPGRPQNQYAEDGPGRDGPEADSLGPMVGASGGIVQGPGSGPNWRGGVADRSGYLRRSGRLMRRPWWVVRRRLSGRISPARTRRQLPRSLLRQ
jgi:hypothetical protein